MSLLMDTQTNRFWARVDFLATGEIVLHIPEECELPIRVLVSRGGRSTEYEPKSSEKPNNCETCRFELYCPEMCEGCCEWDSHYEPKDEPQTDYTPDCPFCKRYGTEDCLGSDCRHYKTYKTEPQTERSE